jgi:enamine deaminase RidA (YjgF/YER057c/UK114 family)
MLHSDRVRQLRRKVSRRHQQMSATSRQQDRREDRVDRRRLDQGHVNLIAQMRLACDGDLDHVSRVVKLGGFVQAGPGFHDIPQVLNGCSDLMVDVFGEQGRHARSAVGVCQSPLGFAVGVDAVIELN